MSYQPRNFRSHKLLKLILAPWRMATVGGLLLGGLLLVAGRAFYLQWLNTDERVGENLTTNHPGCAD